MAFIPWLPGENVTGGLGVLFSFKTNFCIFIPSNISNKGRHKWPQCTDKREISDHHSYWDHTLNNKKHNTWQHLAKCSKLLGKWLHTLFPRTLRSAYKVTSRRINVLFQIILLCLRFFVVSCTFSFVSTFRLPLQVTWNRSFCSYVTHIRFAFGSVNSTSHIKSDIFESESGHFSFFFFFTYMFICFPTGNTTQNKTKTRQRNIWLTHIFKSIQAEDSGVTSYTSKNKLRTDKCKKKKKKK